MKRGSLYIRLAALCCGWGAPAVGQVLQEEGDTSSNVRLENVWWDVTAKIATNRPWAECDALLAPAILANEESRHASACRRLLESIRRAEAREAIGRDVTASSSTEELVAALHKSRVHVRAVLGPNDYVSAVGKFAWTYFADAWPGGSADPASILCERGRDAIPALINALADNTATRITAAKGLYGQRPVVLRVGDVALALIERISRCHFGVKLSRNSSIFDLSAEERTELIEAAGVWWDATGALDPDQAVLWQIEHSDDLYACKMLDTLIDSGATDLALSYLRDHYRDGDALHDQLATRMLRAGSREPLDYIHELVKAGVEIDRTTLRLIATDGEIGDFEMLRRLVTDLRERGAQARDTQTQIIVDVLRHSRNELSVPVLMAVIGDYMLDLDPSVMDGAAAMRIPSYVETAAESVQNLAGIHFGYERNATPLHRLRVFRDIVEWWHREGCGAYGFVQSRAHAPGGIR